MPSDTVLKDIYAGELARVLVKRKRTAKRLRQVRDVAHLWEAHSEAVQGVLRETEDERNAALRERDELRAILRPLLTEAWWTPSGGDGWRCRFCRCLFDTVHVDDGHRSDCPVRRRAALLGEEEA